MFVLILLKNHLIEIYMVLLNIYIVLLGLSDIKGSISLYSLKYLADLVVLTACSVLGPLIVQQLPALQTIPHYPYKKEMLIHHS